MCPFKQLQIKKQNNIDCIYMTSLCCESILSLFWCVEPLKKIRGCGWVFLLIGLALLRTTLCACSRSFWGGAENRSSIGLLIWPAHLFRHFLRRVQCDAVSYSASPFIISLWSPLRPLPHLQEQNLHWPPLPTPCWPTPPPWSLPRQLTHPPPHQWPPPT